MAAVFFVDHCVPTVVVDDLRQAGYEVIPHIMSRLLDFLASQEGSDLTGKLILVEPDRIRIR